jgi:hypothetical protein
MWIEALADTLHNWYIVPVYKLKVQACNKIQDVRTFTGAVDEEGGSFDIIKPAVSQM